MKVKNVLHGVQQAVCLLFLVVYALLLTVAVMCIQIGAFAFTRVAQWLKHGRASCTVCAVQDKTDDSGQKKRENTDLMGSD